MFRLEQATFRNNRSCFEVAPISIKQSFLRPVGLTSVTPTFCETCATFQSESKDKKQAVVRLCNSKRSIAAECTGEYFHNGRPCSYNFFKVISSFLAIFSSASLDVFVCCFFMFKLYLLYQFIEVHFGVVIFKDYLLFVCLFGVLY